MTPPRISRGLRVTDGIRTRDIQNHNLAVQGNDQLVKTIASQLAFQSIMFPARERSDNKNESFLDGIIFIVQNVPWKGTK